MCGFWATPSRRANYRIAALVDVWVCWNCNGREDISRVRDMSIGGLFLNTRLRRATGTPMKIDFLVQEGQIRADAVAGPRLGYSPNRTGPPKLRPARRAVCGRGDDFCNPRVQVYGCWERHCRPTPNLQIPAGRRHSVSYRRMPRSCARSTGRSIE